MEGKKSEAVVFIHGLFMNGWDMGILRQRIAEAGYTTHQFSYSSTSSSVDEIISQLHDFVKGINANVVHYVCHSLGGLIVRHFLAAYDDLPPGRVVTLGTPHNGSGAAKFFNQYQVGHFNIGSMLLGESLNAGLLGDAPEWRGDRDIGVIAGTSGLGLGKLFQELEEPNDGTVSVAETRLENCTDYLELPVSHTGLLISKKVADQTINFLKYGKFDKNDRNH